VDVLEGGAVDGVLKEKGPARSRDVHHLALSGVQVHVVVVAPDLHVVRVGLQGVHVLFDVHDSGHGGVVGVLMQFCLYRPGQVGDENVEKQGTKHTIPWMTPEGTSDGSEHSPLNRTNWVWPTRNDSQHSSSCPQMP